MKLIETMDEAAIVFELLSAACPDEPREGAYYETLDVLYERFAQALGYVEDCA